MGNYVCCDQKPTEKQPQIKPVAVPATNKQQDNIAQRTDQTTPSEKVDGFPQISHKRGPDNYQSIKFLGRGAFGNVVLAEDKDTGKQYAMKVIDKNKIRQFNVLQCKLIQDIKNDNFLVSIRQTFQNQNNIYIIMEYLPKGDIYFYLKKNQVKFTEQIIKGIVAEILVGVEFLHNNGIIYRQMKPENILVTNDGHIKLTDYGLSKVIIENRQHISTFVGTLEYMAPEALTGEFGFKADIWAIGVLMFELIFEVSPFEDKKVGEFSSAEFESRIQKINIQGTLNQNIGKISLSFRDLLIGLLEKQPQKRLSLEQVKNHSFFKGINWQDIKNRRNPGPLKSFIENNDHIKFRDPISQEYIRRKYTNKLTNKDKYQINLYEFRNSH